MIRITKMSGKFYGKEIDIMDEDDIDDIRIFVNECTPVIIVDSIEDFNEFGFDAELIMV